MHRKTEILSSFFPSNSTYYSLLFCKYKLIIVKEIVDPNPEYKKLGERPDELSEQVAAKLSPEDLQLLKEYDDSLDSLALKPKASHFFPGNGR